MFCEMTVCEPTAGVSCQSLDKSCHTEVQKALNLTGNPACKVGSANGACKLTTQECFTNVNNNFLTEDYGFYDD